MGKIAKEIMEKVKQIGLDEFNMKDVEKIVEKQRKKKMQILTLRISKRSKKNLQWL